MSASRESPASGDDIGRQGVVEINGANVLSSTMLRGINVVQFDTMDFHVIQFLSFDTYGGSSGTDTSNSNSLAIFLNTMPSRSLVAMLVVGEGSNSLTQSARSAIKQFGSQYIDNLGWRQPWALFGQKGSEQGTVLEKLLPSTQMVTLDTSINRPNLTGELLSESFGPASQWTKSSITRYSATGGEIEIICVRQQYCRNTRYTSYQRYEFSHIVNLHRCKKIFIITIIGKILGECTGRFTDSKKMGCNSTSVARSGD